MSNAHGSWLQLVHRSHQPPPTEEACFALGSASDGGDSEALQCSPWGMLHHPIHIIRLLLTSSDGKQEATCCVSLP